MRSPYLHLVILFSFLANTLGVCPIAQAQDFGLPAPGVMVNPSPDYNLPILKGIKVNPNNPFRFDFILDKGDNSLRDSSPLAQNDNELKKESTKLIKYFLASITIPEKDLWVNLSPYEKNRIIPQSFGQTEMGRDLLAEDYMLKQITASLMYPEGGIGKRFWKRVYAQAAQKFGTTDIPVNTFNKVWIVPEKAVVYENAKAGTAYIVESTLKVMLEQDYLALSHMSSPNVSIGDLEHTRTGFPTKAFGNDSIAALGSQMIREIIIPELTKEINQGQNFAQLRQVYNSLILADWYKKKIRGSILSEVYADKNKVTGINYNKSVIPHHDLNKINSLRDSSPSAQNDIELIYQRYLNAFKKGVYNYIKEEPDPLTQQIIPRKYFSGGVGMTKLDLDQAMSVEDSDPGEITGDLAQVLVNIQPTVDNANDQAMVTLDQVSKNIENEGVLHPWFIEYNRALRKIINPEGKSFTVAVGFNGADVSNLWLATGFTKAYWIYSPPETVDDLARMSRSAFEKALKAWDQLNTKNDYFKDKRDNGFNSQPTADKDTARHIIEELKAMGAVDVHFNDEQSQVMELLFRLPWDSKYRSIEFIQERITHLSSSFTSRMQGVLDAYYEKANWDYSRNTLRLKGHVELLKPGGYLLVSPYDNSHDTHLDFTQSFVPLGLINLAAHDQEIQGMIHARTLSRQQMGLKDRHYGWDMDVWKKPDQAMNARNKAKENNKRFSEIILKDEDGSRIVSTLSPSDLSKIVAEPRKFSVRQQVNGPFSAVLSPGGQEWETMNSGLDDFNVNLEEVVKRLYAQKKNKKSPFVIFEWGKGDGTAMRELAEKLKGQVPIKVIGLSNDYFTSWQDDPKGWVNILDDALNLGKYIPRYIKPQTVDLVVSRLGLSHFMNINSVDGSLGNEGVGSFNLEAMNQHLNDLGNILRPGAFIILDSTGYTFKRTNYLGMIISEIEDSTLGRFYVMTKKTTDKKNSTDAAMSASEHSPYQSGEFSRQDVAFGSVPIANKNQIRSIKITARKLEFLLQIIIDKLRPLMNLDDEEDQRSHLFLLEHEYDKEGRAYTLHEAWDKIDELFAMKDRFKDPGVKMLINTIDGDPNELYNLPAALHKLSSLGATNLNHTLQDLNRIQSFLIRLRMEPKIFKIQTKNGYAVDPFKSLAANDNNRDQAMSVAPGLTDEELSQFRIDLLDAITSIVGKPRDPDAITPIEARARLLGILGTMGGDIASKGIEELVRMKAKDGEFGENIFSFAHRVPFFMDTRIQKVILGLSVYLGRHHDDQFYEMRVPQESIATVVDQLKANQGIEEFVSELSDEGLDELATQVYQQNKNFIDPLLDNFVKGMEELKNPLIEKRSSDIFYNILLMLVKKYRKNSWSEILVKAWVTKAKVSEANSEIEIIRENERFVIKPENVGKIEAIPLNNGQAFLNFRYRDEETHAMYFTFDDPSGDHNYGELELNWDEHSYSWFIKNILLWNQRGKGLAQEAVQKLVAILGVLRSSDIFDITSPLAQRMWERIPGARVLYIGHDPTFTNLSTGYAFVLRSWEALVNINLKRIKNHTNKLGKVKDGVLFLDPYHKVNNEIDGEHSSVKEAFDYSDAQNSEKIIDMGGGYGLVMVNSQIYENPWLHDEGYINCCGISILARNLKTGKIDIGLTHIFPEGNNSLLETLEITQKSLIRQGYEPLEYIVMYDENEYKLERAVISALSLADFENHIKKDFNNQFPGVPVQFSASRESKNEIGILVSLNGVAKIDGNKIDLFSWIGSYDRPSKTISHTIIDKWISAVNEEYFNASTVTKKIRGRVYQMKGPDGKTYFIKLGLANQIYEYLNYLIARQMGAHVPDVKLFRSNRSMEIKLNQRFGFALVMQNARSYRSPFNERYSGIEEAVAFSYLADHGDIRLLERQNVFKNQKGEFVLYDLEDANQFDLDGLWGFWGQVDIDKLVDKIALAEHLNLNVFKKDVEPFWDVNLTLHDLRDKQKIMRQELIDALESELSGVFVKEVDTVYSDFQRMEIAGLFDDVLAGGLGRIKDVNVFLGRVGEILPKARANKIIRVVRQNVEYRRLYSDKIRELIAKLKGEDKAQVVHNGGIDLTSDKALVVQHNGQGIQFHIDPAQLKELQDASGFTPVIISIRPITDVRLFLGLK